MRMTSTRYFLAITLVCTHLVITTQVLHLANTDDPTLNHRSVVLTFAADWCNACHTIDKLYQDISNDPEFEQILFTRIDIDKNKNLCKKYGVIGVPTFIYVENGIKKGQSIGIKNLASFKDDLQNSLRSHFTHLNNHSYAQAIDASDADILEEYQINQQGFLSRVWHAIVGFFKSIFEEIKGLFA